MLTQSAVVGAIMGRVLNFKNSNLRAFVSEKTWSLMEVESGECLRLYGQH